MGPNGNGSTSANGLYANSQQPQQPQQASVSLSPQLQTPRTMQPQPLSHHSVVTSPQSNFTQAHSHYEMGMGSGSRPHRPVMKSAYSEQLHQHHQTQTQPP